MKKKNFGEKSVFSLFTILLISTSLSTNCQEYASIYGSRARGCSNGGILFQDVWSAGNNQAIMSTIQNFMVGYSHSLKFGMKELQTIGISAILPTKHFAAGININSWGNKHYHENKYGLAISKQIGERYFAGIQFDYLNTFIEDFDRMSNASFEVGFYGRPSDYLRIAFHAFNPFKSGIQPQSEYKTSSIYKLAIGFHFDKGFVFEEVQTTIYEELNFITGIEYPFQKTFSIRCGYSTNPRLISAGTSITFRSFLLSCDFQYNNILGITPSISITHEL